MLTGNHEIINPILGLLFEAEERRLTNWIDKICRDNAEVKGQANVGFIYAGRFYRPSDQVGHIPGKRALHPSLEPDMTAFVRDQAGIELDKSLIKQTLFNLIFPCHTDQQIRDALPDCLVSVLTDYSRLPREQEEAWSIRDNPRAMRQYEAILPKIQIYTAARMMY